MAQAMSFYPEEGDYADNTAIPNMAPNIEPQQPAIRGFTDVPGYAFPDYEGQAITTNYVPEDYGTNPNAQLVGGQGPGVAPVLPPEEYARFDERTKQGEVTYSINDIARMNPKEAGAAIEKQLGPRPTMTDTKAALYKQAQSKFYEHYIATERREPSNKAWALFDEQWEKDPRVMATIKQKQAEYDNQYKRLEKQASDTRKIKKVVDGRFTETSKRGIELLGLITDPVKQKAAKIRFFTGLVKARENPATQEQENEFLLGDLIEPKEEKESVYDLSPDEIKLQADSVADGKRAPKTISARRERGQILTEVSRKYPKFDFSKADANYNYMNNSAITRSAGMVQAAMPRVYDLYKKVLNLQNLTGVPILDKPLNKIRRSVGSEAVTDFESLRNAILTEVNAALSGTAVASDFRIKLELENLGSDMTVGQQIKSITNLISALEARGEASQMILYPWEVVRGEKTTEEWKSEQKKDAMNVRNMIFGKDKQKQVVERRRTTDGRILVKYADGTMGEE